MLTQNQATEETKKQLLASAGRILMKLNKDEGSEGFGVIGSVAGRLFSGGGLDPIQDVSEARIKYLQEKESNLHQLISETNASEGKVKSFLDRSKDLERNDFYNQWNPSIITTEGREALQLISSIGGSLKLEAENYKQRQQQQQQQQRQQQPYSPIKGHVPVSSIREEGGPASRAGTGAGPARRAGPVRGAEAGFGGGGGANLRGQPQFRPPDLDLLPKPRMAEVYRGPVPAVSEPSDEAGGGEGERGGGAGARPARRDEDGVGGRVARPAANTGPDGANISNAGVVLDGPLPGRARAVDDGGGVRFAGGSEYGPTIISSPRRFGDGADNSRILLPGQPLDWGGRGPERRVEVEGSFPPIRGRVDEVRGGGGDWAGEPALGEGDWRFEAARGGDGRGYGTAPEQRGWNPSDIVANSPFLEKGDRPSSMAVEQLAEPEQAQEGGEGGGGPIEAIGEFFKKQVENRLKGFTSAVEKGAGAVDAALAGKTDEAGMRLRDAGDNLLSGGVFAESQREIRQKAYERREEENAIRLANGIPILNEEGIIKVAGGISDRAGALFVDTPLSALGVVANLATLNPEGANKSAEAVGHALVGGVILGESLEVREDAAKERRRAEAAQVEAATEQRRRAAQAEESRRAEQLRRAVQAKADRKNQQQEISPRYDPRSIAKAELGYGDESRNNSLRREPATRGNTLSLDEEDDLEVKIRKNGWRNYLRSFIPSCFSCCRCGLGLSELEEYKPKRNSTQTYESEKNLFEKARMFYSDYIIANSHLQINIDQDSKGDASTFISVSNNSNPNDFLKELTFESIKEEKETARKNTLFKIMRLDPDAEIDAGRNRDVDALKAVDNRIKIGNCQIDRLNIVDLKSDTYKTKIYLDDAGINTIKDFTERNKALFLQYFLNDPNLTAKSFLDSVPRDIPPEVIFNSQNIAHQSALKKASEAVERLVERKMERGDFKFDLDDPDKEIAYVKVLREIDKNGNVKKDNKVEIKTGKEFSEKLKHINLHMGGDDYMQINLEKNTDYTPKVEVNPSFFRKDDKNNFDKIDLKDSQAIRSSKIKIISHDNKETKFKAGSITEKESAEEKKFSCFSCLKKGKPKIKESGVIKYENDGWNIDFEKTDGTGTASAKLIMNGNGKISFDEQDPLNKKLADAFRKALGDKNEVRKFKLVKDNETYEVTIGGKSRRRTFENTCNVFSSKTHGNGILKVEKISGNNLTQNGAVFDNSDDGAGRRGSSWASYFGGGRRREGRPREDGGRQ